LNPRAGRARFPITTAAFRFLVLVAVCLMFGVVGRGESREGEKGLPDAPAPQNTVQDTRQASPPQSASGIGRASYRRRKWAESVEPGESVPRLSPGNKMMFWVHEEAQPVSILPLLYSAGYSQVRNTDPLYGTDSGAFGERLGAAAIRQASIRFFSDSIFPVFTHEDPRYYRKASGGKLGRGLYAMERMFVARSDSGQRRVDISDPMGRLAGSVLTLAYYPEPSRNSGAVLRTWGVSIGGGVIDNEFLEFWPDVVNRWRNRKQK
jgi:hypothetical protein